MKNKKDREKAAAGSPAPGNLSPQERKVLKSSIQAMNNQAEALGILDPLDLEPVLVYSLKEKGK